MVLTKVSRSLNSITDTGRATTGASAAMINAVAIVTVCRATKNTQMFSPNNTPASAARLKSRAVGHRPVRATMINIPPEAIHNLQNDNTTPDAWVDFPSTLPNDQNVAAAKTAGTPPRRLGAAILSGAAALGAGVVATCAR